MLELFALRNCPYWRCIGRYGKLLMLRTSRGGDDQQPYGRYGEA